jgi:hypothetical protein
VTEQITWRRRGAIVTGEVHQVDNKPVFTRAERLALHAAYVRGERSDRVVAGHREYDRLRKRAARRAAAEEKWRTA